MAFAGLLLAGILGLAAPPSHGLLHEHFVQNGDVRIQTFSIGKGPLVLVVPSASRGSEDYTDFAEDIANRGYRVVCINPRGVESSSPPSPGYSLQDAANDLAAVIRDNADGPAILIGHAAGSFSTRLLTVQHPELVRGIVLAAAGAKSHSPDLDKAVQKIGLESTSAEERLQLLRFAFFAPGNDPSSWLTGWYDQHGRLPPIAPSNAVPDTQATATKDPRDAWWGAGNAPVLDLIAGDDAFRPESSRAAYKAQYGTRVTMVVVPHAGHALFPEQPAAVEKAVLAWMATVPGRPVTP